MLLCSALPAPRTKERSWFRVGGAESGTGTRCSWAKRRPSPESGTALCVLAGLEQARAPQPRRRLNALRTPPRRYRARSLRPTVGADTFVLVAGARHDLVVAGERAIIHPTGPLPG